MSTIFNKYHTELRALIKKSINLKITTENTLLMSNRFVICLCTTDNSQHIYHADDKHGDLHRILSLHM